MNAIDYTHEISPQAAGMRPAGVAALAGLFEDQILRQGLHPAAQLVVLHRGQVILDRALGVGRFSSVQKDSPFLAFSVTKPFTGLCALKLVEEGCLELDEPIAKYWPEFGRKGKQSATVRHALLHQAGIPAPHLYRQVPLWPFWGAVIHNVANTEAVYPPGTQVAYHLVNFGFILGEIVRRVSGLSVDTYLSRNFLEPLGLNNTTMRLPWHRLSATPALVAESKELTNTVRIFNLPPIRTSLMPAASLHSTARELAIFYQMLLNGGEYAGQRFLQPETIAAATAPSYEGWDSYLLTPMRIGLGLQLGGTLEGQEGDSGMGKGSTAHTFGHFGLGTCMTWADPNQDLVVAFTTNGVQDGKTSTARWTALSNLVWEALA